MSPVSVLDVSGQYPPLLRGEGYERIQRTITCASSDSFPPNP